MSATNNNVNSLNSISKRSKQDFEIGINNLENTNNKNDENNNINNKFNNFLNNTNKTIKKNLNNTKKNIKTIQNEGEKFIKNINSNIKSTFKLPTMENKLEVVKSRNNNGLLKKQNQNNLKEKKEKESLDNMYKGNMFSKIVGVLILTVIIIGLIYAGSEYYKYNYLDIIDKDKVTILEGIHEGSSQKLISQDPKYKSSIAINKSDGRPGGMEFSYSFWIMINGTKPDLQHIFHKGDKYQINRTPGVYLLPNENTMKLYFNISNPSNTGLLGEDNTKDQLEVKSELEIKDLAKNKNININNKTKDQLIQELIDLTNNKYLDELKNKDLNELRNLAKEHNVTFYKTKTKQQLITDLFYNKNLYGIYETLEITNLPLKKWVNITVTFIENKKHDSDLFNNISVYINGLLKKNKYISSVPVLNSHDLHICNNGGFKGYLGNMYYFSKHIGKDEIFKLVENCPKNIGCGIDADCPPYLDNNWWFN
tara:strand:+ start:47 stop:1489 length:1443 start_codon:yes stop_codon:yes gene_type:complete